MGKILSKLSGAFYRFVDPESVVQDDLKHAEIALPPAREAVGTLMKVAWPAMLEAFLVSLVSLVDNMMVSGIGPAAIAAVGLSTQPRFVLLALFMSLNVGITGVVARRKGENNRESANSALKTAMKYVVVGSIVATVIGVWLSKPFLQFMGAQSDSIGYAVEYFEILVLGMLFNTVALALTAAQRGCGNTKISMTTNIAANLVNLVGNWLLIGGNLGFPQWGVAGAAIATVIGQFVAMCMAMYSIIGKDKFLSFGVMIKSKVDPRNLKAMMGIAGSSATEQIFMRIGFIIFTKVAAGLGTVAYATHQICQNFMHISFSFGDGLSIAASSLVGQSMGKERPDLSLMYGGIAQRIGLIIGCGMTVFFLTTRQYLLIPFSADQSMITMGAQIMIVLALICPGQVSQVIYSSSLRVAGDAAYVAKTSLISITFVRTFVAWFLCYPMKMGVMGIWCGFLVDQYLRLALNMKRFNTGKWMKLKL